MKNIQKLLILSDFSDLSVPLIKYGLALSKHLGAKVWLQYVYHITANVSGDIYISPAVLGSFEDEVQKKFEKLSEKIPALKEDHVVFQIRSGDLVTEANDLIDEENIDLVIMGNRSEGFLTNILGSTANKMIQHAHCPVLSIPQEIEFEPFSKIALAVDLQHTSPEVISFLGTFAKAFSARIDVIHVSQAPVPIDVRQLIHTLDQHLEGLKHQFFHIHAPNIDEAIERHMAGNNTDVLILLPREHPFFDSLFQKSISRQAAYQKKTPLLTIKK